MFRALVEMDNSTSPDVLAQSGLLLKAGALTGEGPIQVELVLPPPSTSPRSRSVLHLHFVRSRTLGWISILLRLNDNLKHPIL